MENTPNKLIWQALGSPAKPQFKKYAKGETCCFCGVYDGDIPKEKTWSSGFTNWDIARNSGSQTVCDYCYAAAKSDLRKSSWVITTDGVSRYKRNELADVLFGEKQQTPFLIYITTSFKKLGQFKVILNSSWAQYKILFEEIQVDFQPQHARPIWDILCQFYSIPEDEKEKKQPKTFFTKDEIRTGCYKLQRIKQFGRKEWNEKENIIRHYRGGGLFLMLLYVLNSQSLGRSFADGN